MKSGSKALIVAVLLASAGAVVVGASSYAQEARSDGEYRRFAEYRHGGHHDGKHRYGRHGRHGGMRLMEIFDTNQDGKLTQAEIDAVRRERLAEFDTNKDGQLTLDEYQALWLDAMRERLVDRFQHLDADGNAVVSAEEFAKPYAKVVMRRDRDGDGELTASDLRRRHLDDDDHDDDDDKD